MTPFRALDISVAYKRLAQRNITFALRKRRRLASSRRKLESPGGMTWRSGNVMFRTLRYGETRANSLTSEMRMWSGARQQTSTSQSQLHFHL
jgi:hypothetical protein